jgi:hypothetical protein
MKPTLRIDLRESTLDELVDFVFDHPEPEVDSEGHPKSWWWAVDLEVQVNPERQLALMAELLRGAGALFPRFTAEQIEQGMWFMMTGGSQWFTALLADRGLSWAPRRTVIVAIYDLYDRLFTRVRVETACYMFWDLLLDEFHGDYSEVADICFQTLVRILRLPQVECQQAALHGLGHLKHAETAHVVSEYLHDKRLFQPPLRKYAEQVLRGEGIL